MLKFITKRTPITFHSKYTFIPPSCYDLDTKHNPVLSVTLGTDQTTFGDLHFRLFDNVVPRTAENFKRLLLGTGKYKGRQLSLIGSRVDRYVIRNYIQFGTMAGGNCSIFGPKFRDESFELFHDRPGLITSISEENTNDSRFAITLAPCRFMDLKNVVFGEVTPDSMENLKKLEALGDKLTKVKILSTKLIQ